MSAKQIQQIEIGMTKAEVRSLLGEPRPVRTLDARARRCPHHRRFAAPGYSIILR
ncbi:MAG: outer membrane protein assembly factor BamE domain-containing protein [Gaiellaceae bacterium]